MQRNPVDATGIVCPNRLLKTLFFDSLCPVPGGTGIFQSLQAIEKRRKAEIVFSLCVLKNDTEIVFHYPSKARATADLDRSISAAVADTLMQNGFASFCELPFDRHVVCGFNTKCARGKHFMYFVWLSPAVA